ncbi:helix-turn-helix transcriptional regulator [Paractinoplanes lichenicola]|uniref:Helix-turn-helix transcriptional regulator n=1 Tax=Paractinoplanes lichenicola TaxID=2802976 RepID=A0ABS1VMR1_9ACTN|nr:helix-turn-helix transcriptional regulator [Actinoplanes lichenicola]MBL7256016.1 helix-turn-helix transcriptional regulator [Actinoplanes lichenicola]
MSGKTAGAWQLKARGNREKFAEVERQWNTLTGDSFPMPAFSADSTARFDLKFRATRVGDVAFTSAETATPVRTAGTTALYEDHVRLWLVHRGVWALGGTRGDTELTVPAGRFALRHVGRLVHYATPPHSSAQVFVLPAAVFGSQLRDRTVTGDLGSAEIRLLVAHARAVHETVPELGAAGIDAVRSTLLELTRAVAARTVSTTDSTLAPVLARAARDLADRLLTEPGLSSARLARELGVSVRTLQRAFAAEGRSLTAHIRDRRLHEARAALTGGRRSVSEVAAHWQFTDGSHLTRLFKRRYGMTPSEYIRDNAARSEDSRNRSPSL